MPILAQNKRATFDYEILDKFEAGVQLKGHEVKAVKTGHISLKGAFVTTKRQGGKELPEIYLVNAYIPLYKHAASVQDHDATRPRKLLLKKSEIRYLLGKKQEKGLTLIPIKMYTKRSLVKLEFGIGRGKKKIDKRETIKKREMDRKIRSLKKISNRPI